MKRLMDQLMRLAYKVAYSAVRCLWFVTRPSIEGVFVAVWHQQRLLVVKNSYRRRYVVPCGRIKRGEALAAAAARELGEEVGIRLEPAVLAYAGLIAMRYGSVLDNGHFFEVTLDRAPKLRVDNREVIWAEFLRPAEALSMPLNPLVRRYLRRRLECSPDGCPPAGATASPPG